MKNRYTLYLTTLLLCAAVAVEGQDFHLTQYENAPQYLNPALTGMFMGSESEYRVNANYRSQWRSVASKPFSTMSLGYDMPFEKRWGLGGYLINNRSGNGNFNNFNFMASGSYRIIDDPTFEHNLSVGLQMGLLYKGFNPDMFLYDEQYSPSAGGLDPDMPSGEAFDRNKLFRFDGNFGMYYRYQPEDSRWEPFVGLSVYHFTMPNESFTSQKKRLPIHYLFTGGSDILVNEEQELTLTPSFLMMYQAKATEYTLNLLGRYHIKDTDFDALLGFGYRWKDAFTIQAGVKYQENYHFRVSYDINTSMLNEFSRGRGAIEFSFIYFAPKKEPKIRAKESFM